MILSATNDERGWRMTEAKKGRPRGRPPVPATEKKVRNFTFRSRGDMHERLSEAAVLSGRSISEEIEYRLDASFKRDDMQAYVDATAQRTAQMMRLQSEEAELMTELRVLAKHLREPDALRAALAALEAAKKGDEK
jgi:hypothetical protein